jgi:hypothetical protein
MQEKSSGRAVSSPSDLLDVHDICQRRSSNFAVHVRSVQVAGLKGHCRRNAKSPGAKQIQTFSILAAGLVTLGFLSQILQTHEEAGFRQKLSLQSRCKGVLMLCQGDHQSGFWQT